MSTSKRKRGRLYRLRGRLNKPYVFMPLTMIVVVVTLLLIRVAVAAGMSYVPLDIDEWFIAITFFVALITSRLNAPRHSGDSRALWHLIRRVTS
jgi:hypothetical protein